MKVLSDNTLKLSKNERRLGNFVIKNEENHVKIFDINEIFTYRARKNTAIGKFLEMFYEGINDDSMSKGLKNYISVMFAVFSAVPDMEFLDDVYKASVSCMERHPDAYGYPKEKPTEKQDDAALEEVKGMTEFEEEVRKLSDEEDAKG